MRRIQNQPILFILLCFLLPVLCIAQNGYQKGYVVTNSNDTIQGLIKDRKPTELLQKIRFKGKNGKKRFGPNKILGYRMGNRYYESVWIDKEISFLKENVISIPGQGEKIFLRVAEKGTLTHYILEFQDQGEQLVQEIDYFKKDNRSELVRVTQGLLGLKKKRVTALLGDCPTLAEKIADKTLKYANEIARYYNDACSVKK